MMHKEGCHRERLLWARTKVLDGELVLQGARHLSYAPQHVHTV